MSEWGIKPQGFIRPGYDDIVSSLEEVARRAENFGPDVDLTPYSPLGLIVQLAAYGFQLLWEAGEDRYYNSFIDTASGVHLDRLCRLIAVYRKPPEYERVTLSFTGDDFTVIPAGFAVETKSGIKYLTEVEATIDAGTADVSAIAEKLGIDQRVNPGQLTEIVSPMAGVLSVINTLGSDGGYSGETDQELRYRALEYARVIANKSGSKNQLAAQILSVPGVKSATIQENNTSLIQNGIPPHSIFCNVDGGTEQDVGEAIFYNKTTGTGTVGDIMVGILDENGVTHKVYFSKPTEVSVDVTLDVQAGTGYSSVTEDTIRDEIIKVIGGVHTYTIDGNVVSQEYAGLGSGEALYELRLYKGISSIAEIVDASIAIKKSSESTYGSKVEVLPNEVLRCYSSNITINLLP